MHEKLVSWTLVTQDEWAPGWPHSVEPVGNSVVLGT